MAKKPTDKPETILQQTYQKFWLGFNHVSVENAEFCKAFTPHPFPSIRSYQDYSIGKPYNLSVGVNFKRQEIHVSAYFSDLEKYQLYFKMKEQIELKVGRVLLWKRHNTKASAALYDTADFDENHGWEVTYQKMMADMLLMKNAFIKFDH